jgi:hypothetical protein
MHDLPAELLAHPFTAATAAAYGVTPRQLRGQRCVQLLYGVYLGAGVDVTVPLLAEAVSLVLPDGAVVSGAEAALLLGADLRSRGDMTIAVTVLREARLRRRGLQVTEALLEDGDVTEVMGVPVTSPVRTAFDLGRNRNLIESVVGIDAMLNRGGCNVDELAAYIAARPGWPGIRWARAGFANCEPRAESPMESRQRMRLVLAGLPRPEAQVELVDSRGHQVARLDHGYRRWKVAPEYDDGVHASSWRHDNERQERIRELGWWHRRYTSLAIADGWQAMVDQVGSALVARGWTPA